jgi:hypothetical protein
MSRFHIETIEPATSTEFLNQSTPASSAIRFPLARLSAMQWRGSAALSIASLVGVIWLDCSIHINSIHMNWYLRRFSRVCADSLVYQKPSPRNIENMLGSIAITVARCLWPGGAMKPPHPIAGREAAVRAMGRFARRTFSPSSREEFRQHQPRLSKHGGVEAGAAPPWRPSYFDV